MRIATILAVALLGTTILAAAEHAQAAIQHYQLNIPRQSLDTALKDLAQQTGLQIGRFSARADGGAMVGPVLGDQTPVQALRTLLNNTGLEYKIVSDTTIAVYNPKDSASARIDSSLRGNEDGGAGSGQSNSANASGSPDDTNTSKEAGKNTSQEFRVAQVDQGKGSSTSSVGEHTSVSPNSPSGGLEEIVVTAQKRTERAQDVPASIQVLTGDQLLQQGVVQLSDYAKQVPGLSLFGGSGAGQGEVVLRGISAGSGSHPLVGIYLDDVPFTTSSPNSDGGSRFLFDPDIADIERIEVLEGPQSTLYGASSMGGVIKYVTKQPDLNDFGGSVRVDGSKVDGGGAGYGVRGSIDVPIVADAIGLRASAFYRDDPGFVDNDYNGVRNINHDSVKGGRLSLRLKFTDDLENTLSGLAQNIDSAGPNLVYLNPQTLRPALDSFAFSSPFNSPTSVANRSISDTTKLSLHFATLTNIASYTTVVGDQDSDWTNFGTYLNPPPPAGTFVHAPASFETKRYNDELRLASSPGRFEWLLGGFYTHEENPDFFPYRGTDASGVDLPPSSRYYNVYTYTNTPIFSEKAVFGDLTYHFTNQVEATGGVRYSSNNQSYHAVGTGDLAGPAGLQAQGNSSDSAMTYLATMSYKPATTTTLYARAASAYRPGGPNILAPDQIAAGAPLTFGPDKLWNYEVGIKGSLWDHRISYSADAYHMDWTDMQLEVLINGGDVVANASSAKSDGVEASLQIVPIDALTVGVNAAYIDAKLTSDIPAPVDAVRGDRLPYAPNVTAAIILDYRLTAVTGAVPRVGFTYAYHGSENTAFTTNASYRLPSYETLDLRGGFDWSRYSVIARIDNVANRYALTDVTPTNAEGTPLGGIVVKPRTFGISFQTHF